MDEIVMRALLYDFYGELLTANQKEIYEQFMLEDLSLGEIAEERGISRQGVHDTIRRCEKTLEGYEEWAVHSQQEDPEVSYSKREGTSD